MDCKTFAALVGRCCVPSRTFAAFRVVGVVLCLAAICGAPAAHGQQITVKLDPAKSEVHFTLGATLHTVHGTFKLKSGTISVDPATGKASGSIVVDATSGESGEPSRDQKMHREILESPKYTEIVFSPTIISAPPGRALADALRASGTTKMQAAGTFRLHGADHPITIPLTVVNDGAGHVDVAGKFPVPYIQWGLKNPSTFILRVSDEVQIEIHGSGEIAGGPH